MSDIQPIHIPPADEQLALLTRGVADLHPLEDLEKRLKKAHETQTPLKIKTGFDPTAPDIHLGHTVLIEKMAQFQRLGHEVTFLVGDFTARIGDPTGRNKLRPPLTVEEILANASTYAEQCFKILDRERTVLRWNSEWLEPMNLADIIQLAASYNLARMMERRDFRDRFDAGVQISMHELLYPLVQGYDSVALECDVELGGHDQIFNLNVGRQLMAQREMRPQIVLTVPLLVGLDGVEKMSKSKNNHIGINEPARDIFGKTMSISDDTMWGWIPLLTGGDVEPLEADPLSAKKGLAEEMVRRFHGEAEAKATRAWWDGGRVGDLESVTVSAGPLYVVVRETGKATSGGDAKRKIKGGGVSLDGNRITDPFTAVEPGSYELRVGKKVRLQLTVSPAE